MTYDEVYEMLDRHLDRTFAQLKETDNLHILGGLQAIASELLEMKTEILARQRKELYGDKRVQYDRKIL